MVNTLLNDDFCQTVAQAESQLANNDGAGGSVDFHRPRNGDGTLCVLWYAGVLPITNRHGECAEVNQCLCLYVAGCIVNGVLKSYRAQHRVGTGSQHEEHSQEQCNYSIVFHISIVNYQFSIVFTFSLPTPI